jgi:hypothetical protein
MKKLSKQDRQGVRTPADLELKYNLSAVGGSGGASATDFQNLKQELDTTTARLSGEIGRLEDNKANQSGWTPDKFLGTDERGNIVEKDAPSGVDSNITSAIVLTDQSTGRIYNLYMSDGGLMLGESKGEVLPPSLDATLTDNTTGKEYKLYVSNGKLMLAESEV